MAAAPDVAASGTSDATMAACAALTRHRAKGNAQSGIPSAHASPSTRDRADHGSERAHGHGCRVASSAFAKAPANSASEVTPHTRTTVAAVDGASPGLFAVMKNANEATTAGS